MADHEESLVNHSSFIGKHIRLATKTSSLFETDPAGSKHTSLLAGGYWGFHRGKPVPFTNRAPSWIFEARAPGYERVAQKSGPAPVPSLTLSTLYPGPDLAARTQDGDLITNSGFFFDHPTACVQAKNTLI